MPVTEIGQRLAPTIESAGGRGSSSAPQSRSNSWKNKHRNSNTRRHKRISHASRTNSVSMPDCSDTESLRKMSTASKECPFCMVRSFKTTSKGIVDSGSFSKSASSNSLLSSGSLNTSHSGSANNSSDSRSTSEDRTRTASVDSSDDSETPPSICVTPSYFRTLVLGASGVGKSSLVHQFTRSESQNDDYDQRTSDSAQTVSVELDGHESTMEFIDGADLSDLECYRADAFVIMYAVSEPESFAVAVNLLNHLRHDLGTDRTIFLVANKSDLIRQRLVPPHEATFYTSSNDCRFIEISTSLNTNLDELLVGILCNIKRQLTPVPDMNNQESPNRLKASSSESKPRSSSRALSVISNFLKHACRREHRRRDVTPVPQLV